MKRLLLSISAAGFLFTIQPVKAQLFGGPGQIVFDPTAVARIAESIGVQSESLDQLVSILQTGIQTYNQLVQLYQLTQVVEQDIDHFTSANGIAAELAGLTNSLAATTAMPAALTGNGAFGNGADGWAAQYWAQNVVYDPTTAGATDPIAMRMHVDAQWLANAQGAATNNMDDAEQRIAGLADLQSCVDASATIQDEGACNSRLAYENAIQANKVAQATNLLVNTNAQHAASIQWQQQQNRYQLDNAQQALCSSLSGLGTTNVSATCVAGGGGGQQIASN